MKTLKILFIVILGITLATGLAYGASHGKGKGKGKVENPGGANNNKGNKSNNGQGNGRVEGPPGHSNNAQAARGNSEQRRRRNQIERARGHADARANRPEKENNGLGIGHYADGVNKPARIARGRSADHKKAKEGRVGGLFKALEKAIWAYNPHDERGQGNMGKPNMRDPYGHDKDSGREGSERGRPIREQEPSLDLAGIVGIDFTMQDYYLDGLTSALNHYLSLIQQYPPGSDLYNLYTSAAAHMESVIEDYISKNRLTIRVDLADTIDYTMSLSPPEGFEGTTLQVTTTLTSINDYDLIWYRYVYDPITGTYQKEVDYEIHYDAGQAVIEQTQEVVLGPDNTISFSYDPPADLAGPNGNGFTADLNVTITEPVSGQSYTESHDKELYFFRCPYGKVTNAKTGEPLVGARVTVHFEDGSIVPLDKASNPTATNPQITDATGRYGVKLQTNRKYYITATSPGYKEYKSEIFTEKWHVLREDIALTPIEQVALGR